MSEILRGLLDASCANGRFDEAKFFRLWFDEHGDAYYFLFKKNLRVTNIQFVELLRLLRTYTFDRDTETRKHELLFLSSRDFKNELKALVEEDSEDGTVLQERLSHVSALYGDLIKRMVVLDTFYGSAAVFVPPNLRTDLARICYLAGYVHSCGRAVFIRAIDKLTRQGMEESIERLLRRYPSEQPIFFAPYSHEDFTSFDRDVASNLRDGLDDVKLYVEKFFVAGQRLPEVLTAIRKKFKGKLTVPPPGDYREVHLAHRKQGEIDPQRTIWLIVDVPIDDEGERLEGRYLICYDQMYFNSCPFQIFDENKPAWVAHTTIPHSLMRAMLNATLPWADQKVIITDPFVGTGTTWFECLKYNEVSLSCSDLDPAAPLLVRDNLEFFSLSPQELRNLADRVRLLVDSLRRGFQPELFKSLHDRYTEDDFSWATELLADLFGKLGASDPESGAFLGIETAGKLRGESFARRLLVYLLLRAQLRYLGAFTRRSIDLQSALIRESRILADQIHSLSELVSNVEAGSSAFGTGVTYNGLYSIGCAIDPEILRTKFAHGASEDEIAILDCRDLPPSSVDILVADPPYGFNTSDPNESLGELYKEMIDVFVRALRNDGQLMICLPEISFTGRRLPISTRKGLVVHQVLVAAERAGKEVVQKASALPRHGALLRAPYYWESDKALRRVILHFRLRDKAIENVRAASRGPVRE